MTIQSRTSSTGITTHTATVRMPTFGVASVSETFPTRAEAASWKARTRADIKAGTYSGVANKTIGDVLDYYRDNVLPARREDYDACLGLLSWWKERLGRVSLRVAISNPAVFDPAFAELEAMSSSTFNNRLTILTQAFKAAKARRWVPGVPFEGLVQRKSLKDSERVRFLSPDELDRLLDACRTGDSQFLPYIVCVALGTGGRRGEVSWLRWPDVEIYGADPHVTFRGTPSKKKVKKEAKREIETRKFGRRRQTQMLKDGTAFRKVPLEPGNIALGALHELAARIPQREGTNLLFPSPSNPHRPVNFRTAFETAVVKAGIEDFVFHDLRHTFASYKKMSGADEYQLMGLLGHKSTDMVKRYAHIDQAYLREAMGRTRLPGIGI